jgi:hypothetical protein
MIGIQVQVINRHRVLWAKVTVLSADGKGSTKLSGAYHEAE